MPASWYIVAFDQLFCYGWSVWIVFVFCGGTILGVTISPHKCTYFPTLQLKVQNPKWNKYRYGQSVQNTSLVKWLLLHYPPFMVLSASRFLCPAWSLAPATGSDVIHVLPWEPNLEAWVTGDVTTHLSQVHNWALSPHCSICPLKDALST